MFQNWPFNPYPLVLFIYWLGPKFTYGSLNAFAAKLEPRKEIKLEVRPHCQTYSVQCRKLFIWPFVVLVYRFFFRVTCQLLEMTQIKACSLTNLINTNSLSRHKKRFRSSFSNRKKNHVRSINSSDHGFISYLTHWS